MSTQDRTDGDRQDAVTDPQDLVARLAHWFDGLPAGEQQQIRARALLEDAQPVMACDSCGQPAAFTTTHEEWGAGVWCEACIAYRLGREHGRAAALEDSVVALAAMASQATSTTEATITRAAVDGFTGNTGQFPIFGDGPAGYPVAGERPWLDGSTPLAEVIA